MRHLEEQITDNETVGVHLRLPRDAVFRALAHAEAPAVAQPARTRQ